MDEYRLQLSIKDQLKKIYQQLEDEELDTETRRILVDLAYELSQSESKENQILD